MAEYSPMMQHYLATKNEYKDCILFYRLGDFYEMFFEDALIVSKELELTLTGKDCGQEERAPMCGVPFHAAETYINRLVAAGHKVAICEQMETGKPLQKRLWQQVVIQKIRNQALCLQLLELDGHEELLRMCKEVQSGDRTHVEAKAAAYYFRCMYGLGFSRGNDHIINSALNYGYAIIRGMIARSIICYGLEPSIGIFHHSELNNYNLADDMIEPFRPLVDLYVSSHFDISEIDSTLTPEMKKGLFGIINFDMSVKGDMRIVSNCIDMLIASYSSALQGNRTELDLPELIQLQVHSYE